MASTNNNRSKKRRLEGSPWLSTTKRKKVPNADPEVEDQPLEAQPKDPERRSNSLPLVDSQQIFLEELRKKYEVLVASVISSTKIKNRVVRAVEHLSDPETKPNDANDKRPRLVFLHARPADVCKMITIAEKAKHIISEGGRPCYQYNQLLELPPRPQEPEVIEQTVLEGQEEESESDDGFERTDIFERAVNPAGPPRKIKTLGIFLSRDPLHELKSRPDVTVQARN